ncbi:MAG: hypothetical protein IT258_02050 [Saprospiraceae bacterium]|nr:hypothetical protein [Saprospiraceae bacterium]
MKQLKLMVGLFLSLVFFTNCQEKTGGPTAAGSATNADLVGYWVNVPWWEELKATKSPRQAFTKLQEISGAIIYEDKGKIVANLAYNWHEGGLPYGVRTREGKQELYDPTNAATPSIPLVFKEKDQILLGNSNLLRLGAPVEGTKAVGHVVLGGEYDLNGKKVVFNPNGTIVGLEGFQYYELQIDYVIDESGTDEVSLSNDGSNPKFFAFKIEGDHLIISELVDNKAPDAKTMYTPGQVKFDLVKK